MLANPRFAVEHWVVVLGVVLAIVAGKFLICSAITWLFGYTIKTTLFVGMGLIQIGEFSFLLASVGMESGIITDYLFSLIVTSAIITIMLTPGAFNAASSLYQRLSQRKGVIKYLAARTDPSPGNRGWQLSNHVVICGHGRVGGLLASILERRGFSYLVIDLDPHVISALRRRGVPCIYGDASNPEILHRAELAKARVLVIAFPDPTSAELLVRNALNIKPKLDIVARVHSDSDASALQKTGASEVVQPEFEAGLEVIRHTLHRFGLSSTEIQYLISRMREKGQEPS